MGSKTLLLQLQGLLWKAFLLRRRHYFLTFFDAFAPIFLFYIVLNNFNSIFLMNDDMPEKKTLSTSFVNLPKCFSNNIIYAPSVNFTKTLMQYVKENLCDPTIYDFKFVEEALQYRRNHKDSASFDLILFEKTDSQDFRYSISIFDFFDVSLNFETLQYHVNRAFMSMQKLYETKALSEKWKINRITLFDDKTKSSKKVWLMISMIFQLVHIQLLQLTVRRIMVEKQSGAKELLQLMGMNNLIYWLAHFLDSIFMVFIQGFFVTILATSSWIFNPLITYTSSSLFLIIYLSLAAITILYAFLVTTFFNKAVMANIISFVSWAIALSASYSVYANGFKYAKGISWKISWMDLLPPNYIIWSLELIGEFESLHVKDNIFKIGPESNISFAIIFALIFTISLIYFALTYYLEAVWPFQSTPAEPWNFIFKKSFWTLEKENRSNVFSLTKIESKYFEPLPEGTEIGVKTFNISKFYGFGLNQKQAVNNVSLDFVKGQIHVLLGHNGAGKTTLMNMISGLLSPSQGTAQISGYDIRAQRKLARSNMSICPQNNLLFEDLSVEEHLKLFAIIKGMNFQEAKKNVKNVLINLHFTEKQKVLSKNLSGGMKRKLQLGIAIVSESEVVILDEPTSGLDPEARRFIWDALLKFKRNKTILLTTHFMEEADALGDRISIMSNGKLCCVGSPLFLKKLYGTGYILHLSTNEIFNKFNFDEFIQKILPEAFLLRINLSEVVYCLPDKLNNELTLSQNLSQSITTFVSNHDHLSIFFDKLDQEKDQLGITSYGVSITTMDDVFFKVTDANGSIITEQSKEDDELKPTTAIKISPTSFLMISGFKLYFHQIKGLFLKRFHYAKRHWQLLLVQAIIPSLFLLFGMHFVNSIYHQVLKNETEPVKISLSNFPKRVFYIGNHLNKIFEEVLIKDGGKLEVFQKLEDFELADFDFGIREDQIPPTEFDNFTFWANNDDSTTIPLLINSLHNALYRSLTKKDVNISINRIDAQVPLFSVLLLPKILNIILMLFFSLSLSMISASFAMFPFYENQIKSKLVQKMTGISSCTFWLSSFLFDVAYFSLVALLLLIMIVFTDKVGAINSHFSSLAFSFILLFIFGYAIIPFGYLISFIPLNSSTAIFNSFSIVTFILGVMYFIVSEIAKILGSFFNISYGTLVVLLELFPPFAIAKALVKVFTFGSFYSICPHIECNDTNSLIFDNRTFYKLCCQDDKKYKIPYLNWSADEGILTEIFIMFIIGTLSFSMLIAIESNIAFYLYAVKNMFKKYQWLPTQDSWNNIEDEEVKKEKDYVKGLIKNHDFNKEALIAYELVKKYKNFLAVNNLSFSLHNQECFGLLGINGAGKSTTFRMLCGDLILTYGNAYIKGYDVKMHLKKFQSYISYCPQFDPLLDNLTPNETLALFARLRGIPEGYVSENVKYLIELLGLKEHVNYRAGVLSGGNKRKLSLGVALIASPSVIFLDEPTTGVDPSSRRKIWSVLQHHQKENSCSIILCSHSMEECEVLCSRIGIMLKGQFKCIGTIQHLRDKYGQGYSIILKLKNEALHYLEIEKVKNYIENNFKNVTLTDIHGVTLHYHVNSLEPSWSKRFHLLEIAKTQGLIQDFIISGTSLEQIFLSFARN